MTIIIPETNVSDLREIPKELKRRIEFVPVRHMREVLEHVLVSPLDWQASGHLGSSARSGAHAVTAQVRRRFA